MNTGLFSISRRRFLRAVALVGSGFAFTGIGGRRKAGSIISYPASPSIPPEAQAFTARLFTFPTADRLALYGDLIESLVAAGIWGSLDCLYILAAADQLTALANLVSGLSRAIWPQQLGLFTVDCGTTSMGTSAFLDTGFNPSTAPHFSQDSACLFAWNLSPTPQPGYMVGSTKSHISPYNNNAGNHTLWAINSASEVDSGNLASDASGFWLVNRTARDESSIKPQRRRACHFLRNFFSA